MPPLKKGTYKGRRAEQPLNKSLKMCLDLSSPVKNFCYVVIILFVTHKSQKRIMVHYSCDTLCTKQDSSETHCLMFTFQ